VVFFGTEKNNCGEDFLHMYLLQVNLKSIYNLN